jgi:hypothetical protein
MLISLDFLLYCKRIRKESLFQISLNRTPLKKQARITLTAVGSSGDDTLYLHSGSTSCQFRAGYWHKQSLAISAGPSR